MMAIYSLLLASPSILLVRSRQWRLQMGSHGSRTPQHHNWELVAKHLNHDPIMMGLPFLPCTKPKSSAGWQHLQQAASDNEILSLENLQSQKLVTEWEEGERMDKHLFFYYYFTSIEQISASFWSAIFMGCPRHPSHLISKNRLKSNELLINS